MNRILIPVCLAGILGCAAPRPDSPDSTTQDRNPALAEQLTRRASELLKEPTSLDAANEAEALLLRALDADPFHGQAHNNLGTIVLRRGDLARAAEAFERARTLMPGLPEPRVNLGLTFERAGRTTDAIDAYASALAADPDHIQAAQALARLQILTGRTDDRTPQLLQNIALRGGSEEWRSWARQQHNMSDNK